MNSYYPNPVTGENFPQVWLTVDEIRLRVMRKGISCLILVWLSGLIFLVFSLLGLGRVLCQYRVDPFADLLALFPTLPRMQKFLGWMFLLAPGNFLMDLLFVPVMAFLLVFGISLPIYLLIRLVYRPQARPIPEDSPKENAAALLANAQEIMERAARIRPAGWFAFPFCFFLGIFGLLTLCILVSGDPAPVLREYMTASAALNYMILFLCSTGLFTAVYGLAVYAVWDFCRVKLRYEFVADIECYSFFAAEKAGKLSYGELLARRKDKAAKTCQAALEKELAGAYGKAAALFLEAAHGGDASAMEHYARHCLVSDSRIPAEYWLRRCVATGESSKSAKKMLRRLRMGMQTGAAYIREPKQK